MNRKFYLIIYFVLFTVTGAWTQNLSELVEAISRDDSKITFEAYIKLFETDPEKSKSFFANRENEDKLQKNENLKYCNPGLDIVPMAYMTKYCRERKIQYKSDSLHSLLLGLYKKLDDYERLFLEYKILSTLELKDIAALEYYGFIYGNYGGYEIFESFAFDVSINRILDILYEKHWPQIVKDDQLLHFYVNKCNWFAGGGITTSQALYYRRFKKQPIVVRERLYTLYQQEKEEAVQQAFLVSIQMTDLFLQESQRLNVTMPLSDYIKAEDEVIPHAIMTLGRLKKEDLDLLFSKIRKEKKENTLQDLLNIVDECGSYEMTPYLIGLFGNRRAYLTIHRHARFTNGDSKYFTTVRTVEEKALECLQKIHNCIEEDQSRYDNSESKFLLPDKKEEKIKFWKALWKTNGEEVALWKEKFINATIKRITEADTLYDGEIGSLVWNKKLLTEEQRKQVIAQSVKIKYASEVRGMRLQDEEYLPKELLGRFRDVKIHYSDYKEILDKIDHKDHNYIKEQMMYKIKSYDEREQGQIIEHVLYRSWFKSLMLANLSDTTFINFIKDRFIYIERGSSSIEAENRFFEETFDKTVNQKIDYMIKNDLVNNYYIANDFFDKLNWEESMLVIKRWKELKAKRDYVLHDIINEYLGIAVVTIDSTSMEKLIRDCAEMNEFQLKCQYLKEAGMPVVNDLGILDYNLVYEYLHKNYVYSGFVTGGNGPVKEIISPVIDLLKTRFNSEENDVNYWIGFLKEKNLVDVKFNTEFLGKFNHTHAEDTIFNK